MKTIKIFLASSEELEAERNAFGNLVRRLDYMYERRGIRVKLFEWEDYDAAYNDKRKQEEYNEKVRECDLFLAMFYKKAGDFTVEEFDVATDHFREYASPKVYAYCKDLLPDDEESPELKAFKKRLFEEMGHYWCRYNNRDSMHLHFVMQLQLVESNNMNELKVESGIIKLGDTAVARMENLPCIGGNEEYQKLNHKLLELAEKIAKIRVKLERHPEDEDYKEDLQDSLNEYNALKEYVENEQKNILDTAKQMAQLMGQVITHRMRRAIDAFQEGRGHEAKIILSEAEKDNDTSFQRYKAGIEIAENERKNLLLSLDELLLKASIVLSDSAMVIEDRIKEANRLYTKVEKQAYEINCEPNKYIKLLTVYSSFLIKYAKYEKAEEILNKLQSLHISTNGEKSEEVANVMYNLGCVNHKRGDYNQALDLYRKSVEMIKEVKGNEYNAIVGACYNRIGCIYTELQNFSKSLSNYQKGLGIYNALYGPQNVYSAEIFNSIGAQLIATKDLSDANWWLQKSLSVYREKHMESANVNMLFGRYYTMTADFDKAEEYLEKAKAISIDTYGSKHPVTAKVYIHWGEYYIAKRDCAKALKYLQDALQILCNVFLGKNADIALCYENIGRLYLFGGNSQKALYCIDNAIKVSNEIWEDNKVKVADRYSLRGEVFMNLNKYKEAEEQIREALRINCSIFGDSHVRSAVNYSQLGCIYWGIEDYHKAHDYANKAYKILVTQKEYYYEYMVGCLHVLGMSCLEFKRNSEAKTYLNAGLEMCLSRKSRDELIVAEFYTMLAFVFENEENFQKVQELLEKAFEIKTRLLGSNHEDVKNIKKCLDETKSKQKS